MKKTVYRDEFVRAFDDANRGANFTYEGRRELFDYLERYEDDCGEEMELDVIAICCDFSEYANLKEFQDDYGDEYETFDDIERSTTVIKIDTEENEDGIEDGSFIIQNF